MIETLELEGLTFGVRRSTRRQTIGLTVDRGGELLIHAPDDTERTELARWTRSKLLWVHQKLARKEESRGAGFAPEFISGETFYYLGKGYRLKISDEHDLPLHWDRRFFWLRRESKRSADALFRNWYIGTGAIWVKQRAALLSRKAGVTPTRMELRDLGFRWGSCSKTGVLLFNWKLLQLPLRLIDYVLLHELVHLKERHHGPQFWEYLEQALPDAPARREQLRITSQQFIRFGLADQGDIPRPGTSTRPMRREQCL